MSTDPLRKARDLMDEGKYRQARSILKKIDSTAARSLLAEIDELEPLSGTTRARDALHVLLLGLIFTGLFGGAGFLIASGMGADFTPRQADSSDSSSSIGNSATLPTATAIPPTPTDIPCEAQAWWEANNAPLSNTVDRILSLEISVAASEIQAAKTAYETWKTGLESAAIAPCLSDARQTILAAAPAIDLFYSKYLTTSTDQERAQAFVGVMDSLLPVTDALGALSADTSGADWIQQVQDFTRAECPARRWHIEVIQGRAYARFFTVFDSIDYNQFASAQENLRTLQNLRSAFFSDSSAFPECLKTAADYLVKAMDGFIGFGNARLGGDIARADSQFRTGNAELANFYAQLSQLDSSLANIRLR